MSAHLRCYDGAGTFLGLLTEAKGITRQEAYLGPSALSFNYPWNGLNAALLDRDDGTIALWNADGLVETFLLEDDGDDPGDQAQQARDLSVSGRGLLAILERGRVYPQAHTPGMTKEQIAGLDPVHVFVNTTPGGQVLTLLQRAQARGACTGITANFTSAVDSAGVPWPTAYSFTWTAGTDLLAVLTKVGEDAWADYRMAGTVLEMYVPDTALARDMPNARHRLSREVLSGPRKRTRRAIASTVLAVGDEGAVVERTNATTTARYGRREGYIAGSGITALDTLILLSDAELVDKAHPSEGFTISLDLDKITRNNADPANEHAPVPGVDYRPGDYVRLDSRRLADGSYEPLRVRTIAYEYGDGDQPVTASVELNDPIVEASIRLARKVNAITNGASNNSRAPQPASSVDSTLPLAPAAVTVSSATYLSEDGSYRGTATVTWTQVTQNTDGSAYDDFGYYGLSVSIGGRAYGPETIERTTTASLEGLAPGQTIRARVRTVDATSHASGWTTSPVHTVNADTTPPPVPSTPSLTLGPGVVRATWDGKGSAGEAMPADFARLDVHASSAGGFTPTAATRVDTLFGPGVVPLVALTYDAAVFVRFVAVDRAGLTSTSAQATATPRRVSGLDVGQLAIDTANMADGAVRTAKIGLAQVLNAQIANLAVDDAKIGSVSVGKLVAGVLVADVTVSARIKTADTGARVEVSGLGLQAYDSAGVQTVNIPSGSGAPSFKGAITSGSTITGTSIVGSTFKTAPTGKRVEVQSSTAYSGYEDNGGLYLWSASTAQAGASRITGDIENVGSTGERVSVFITSGNLRDPSTGTLRGESWIRLRSSRRDGADATVFDSQPGITVSSPSVSINNSDGCFVDNVIMQADNGTMAVEYGQTPSLSPSSYYKGSGQGLQHTSGYASAGLNNWGFFGPRDYLAGGLRFVQSTQLGAAALGVDVVQADASSFLPIRASEFRVSSDARVKGPAREVDLGGLAAVRKLRPKKWRRLMHGKPDEDHREERGLVAQDLPLELQVDAGDGELSYSVTEVLALNLQATNDLDAALTALTARVDALPGGKVRQ